MSEKKLTLLFFIADWGYIKIPVSKEIQLDFVYPDLSALLLALDIKICVRLGYYASHNECHFRGYK